MALMTIRPYQDSILELSNVEEGLFPVNHVFEPEYHQEIYVQAGRKAAESKNAFQIGSLEVLTKPANRGIQPKYADIDDDPETLTYIGMVQKNGEALTSSETSNICALKSVSIRWGYIDFGEARCVDSTFYEARKKRASVKKNDVLINSTGDGTIGRVAVFDEDFPCLVDGHVTILRFQDPSMAWYTAAYLLSDEGQNQIYRYINGSSGQVEIYPQDISRIWIPVGSQEHVKEVASIFKKAVDQHRAFYQNLKKALKHVEV